jgi:transposase
MAAFTRDEVSGTVLDHLGLVKAVIDDIGLIDKIDQRIPLKNAKLTIGERVVAMTLNGLGFIDDRLYMIGNFMANKPLDRLFSRELLPEYFNDDSLGRALDKIAEYGITKLFTELAFAIGQEQGLLGRTFNIDSTTLTVYGDYDNEEEGQDVIQPDPSDGAIPAYGYAKNKRCDLKQMVLILATTGIAGFPLWMESHSGNASDKVTLDAASQRMKQLCCSIKDAPDFLVVGDSAIYEACLKSNNTTWLSRVPATHKTAKNFLGNLTKTTPWTELDNGYKIYVQEVTYQGVKQRWAAVFSAQAQQRELGTLERKLVKMDAQLEKELWHLSNQVFECRNDANKALTKFTKTLSWHQVLATIEPVMKHKHKGRPQQGKRPELVGFSIQGSLSRKEDKITDLKQTQGLFLLATNQLDRNMLPDNEILAEYKGQAKTESGFKFIKDNTFQVASIFLKKPHRIAALMMIMTLCLMIYAISQHRLRQALAAAKDTIPSQTKKETARPSMRWVYRMFNGVQVVSISMGEKVHQVVINLRAVNDKVIRYFGPKAMVIYGLV